MERAEVQTTLKSGQSPDLNESDGILSWVSNNVAKPFANAAFIEPTNGVASSINDLSSLAGGGKLLDEAQHFQVRKAKAYGTDWTMQALSTGAGSLVPYLAASLAAKGGLKCVAGEGKGLLTSGLRSNSTAMIVGGTSYDFLRKPGEGQTRLSNGLGSLTAMLTFEGGNRLALGRSFLDRCAIRATTGTIAGNLHVGVSGLVATGEIPQQEKMLRAGVSSSLINVALPGLFDKISPGTASQASKMEAAVGSELSASASTHTRRTVMRAQGPPERVVAEPVLWTNAPDPVTYVSEQNMQGLIARTNAIEKGTITSAELPRLPTSELLTDGALLDFHKRVATTIRDFRSSNSFVPAYERYAELGAARRTQTGYADDLIAVLNRGRPLNDQLKRSSLLDADFLKTVEARPDLRTALDKYQTARQNVLDLSTKFSRNDLRGVTGQLRESLGFLSEELGMPQMRLGFKRMAGKDYAYYDGGSGVEYVNARYIIQGKPSEVSPLMGHEAVHGYQDYLVVRHIADRLGIGRELNAVGLQKLQQTAYNLGHTDPTGRWARAIMAVRDGRPLDAKQADHATKLLLDCVENAEPVSNQAMLKSIDQFLIKNRDGAPVTEFLRQIREPEMRAQVFPGGTVPEGVAHLEAKLKAGKAVDGWYDRETLRTELRKLGEDLEATRYLQYRNSFHERDAWNLEERMRLLISEKVRRRL